MGYKPNFVGRALVSGRTFAAGILRPSKASALYDFYRRIEMGMAEEMEKDDYHLLLLTRSDDFRYSKVIEEGRVDGIFVLQSDLQTVHIEKVAGTGIPTVAVNKHYENEEFPNAGCAESDHKKLIFDVLDEFAALGCRSVLEVNDYRDTDANRQIFDGFAEWFDKNPASGVTGFTMIPSRDSFSAQVKAALAAGQRWDGVFIDGLGLAVAFEREMLAAGLAHGKDYRLITCDTFRTERSAGCPVVSAHFQQPEKMGAAAWRVMKSIINGDPSERTERVPYIK
jgi:DNA-binding LacI/PurR family transcriptional regulator